MHYTGTLGHSDFLIFDYVISTKDNVFTVTNSLGTFTDLAKCTNVLCQMWLQL